MSYNMTNKEVVLREDDEMDVMYRLIEFADRTPSFKDDFFLTCEKMLEQNGYLSGKQVNQLIGIYEKNCASTQD